jgi:hypothetical protein
MKKILFSLLIPVAIFGASFFLKPSIVKAAVGVFPGWIWGGGSDSAGTPAGVGWISLKGSNAGAGGGTYSVNVPNADGKVSGYAWSSNMGYIDFEPQTNCTTGTPTALQYKAASCTPPAAPTTAGVFRTGNNISGWARFVDIAKETVKNNSGSNASGPMDGWIRIYPITETNAIYKNYEVTVDASKTLTGFAYSEFGPLAFTSDSTTPPCAPDPSCAANTCVGNTCYDSCGNGHPGTDNTSPACCNKCLTTCEGETCSNCGTPSTGTMDCGVDWKAWTWKEVAPW